MPHVRANDIRVHYEIYGEGPPLFLVGGYAQHKLIWKDYFEPLSKRFQIIAFDNRGAGETDAPSEPYSIKIFVQDIIGLMDALHIESAHFMGQSMGSAIIQQLCCSYPEKVAKVILCTPFAKLPAISCHKARVLIELLQRGVDKRLIHKLNASWMLSNRFIEEPENDELFIQMAMQDPHPQPMEGVLGQAHAVFACDLRREIEIIPHEVLLLVGERDIATPPYCAKEIAAKVKNTQTHIFKEMGHLFPWETPNQVIKQALGFLV